MNYQLIQGDCIQVLKTLPANSVQMVCTSPPYYSLRDYQTATWEGGDPACDHKTGRFTTPVSGKQRRNNGSGDVQAREICPHCGARRIDAQIGLEETPDCGLHGRLRIKKDLTPDQLRYVIQRLADAGLLGARSCDMEGTR